MPAFTAWLQPSIRLRWLVMLLHVCALPAIVFYSTGIFIVLWSIGWMISAYWGWRGCRQLIICSITIDAQGQAWLLLPNSVSMIAAQLSSYSQARSGFLSLRWHTEDKIINHLLLPDMTDRQAWRRLQVWIRWCQPTRQEYNQTIKVWYSKRNQKTSS